MELADEGDAVIDEEDRVDPTPVEEAPAAAKPLRGPKPRVTPGFPIREYTQRQLVDLAARVLSDTLLRTDDELLVELRQELGFKRGASRINAALMQAIAVVRSRTG